MSETEVDQLERDILRRLAHVVDPETGADVIRMRLVEDLIVDTNGKVNYTFHPSSPLCPIAVYLVKEIKGAIGEIPGVTKQEITVTGYVAAEALTQLINKEN